MIESISSLAGFPPLRAMAADSPRSAGEAAAAGTGRDEPPPADPEQVRRAVDRLNHTVRSVDSQLEFSIDTDSRRTVVKVVDNRTRQVLRQFPSEEALRLATALDRFTGLLIRERA